MLPLLDLDELLASSEVLDLLELEVSSNSVLPELVELFTRLETVRLLDVLKLLKLEDSAPDDEILRLLKLELSKRLKDT